eukprot:3532534-Rhodomonas_salina.3
MKAAWSVRVTAFAPRAAATRPTAPVPAPSSSTVSLLHGRLATARVHTLALPAGLSTLPTAAHPSPYSCKCPTSC